MHLDFEKGASIFIIATKGMTWNILLHLSHITIIAAPLIHIAIQPID